MRVDFSRTLRADNLPQRRKRQYENEEDTCAARNDRVALSAISKQEFTATFFRQMKCKMRSDAVQQR
jgi:hypothetical protein